MTPILIAFGMLTSYILFGVDVYKNWHINHVILSCRVTHSGEAEGYYYFVSIPSSKYLSTRVVYRLCIEGGSCTEKIFNYQTVPNQYFNSPFEKITVHIPAGTKSFKVTGQLQDSIVSYDEKVCQLLPP